MSDTNLFEPVTLGGDLSLANRIVMAPLTRSRAGKGDIPGPMNAEYYAQRATAGLIISEAAQISLQGKGYAYTPGIYTPEQVAGWRLVTDAVHGRGGKIVCQLWHVGRISHPDLQGGPLPVSASDVKPEKTKAFTEAGFQEIPAPRPLETAEIAGLVESYRHAAACAKQAGFDGVEIHAANGYLLEQFLRTLTNHRTDQYGGSVENRVRLTLEVAAAVTSVWAAGRVGIRLSPVSPANDMAGFEDAAEVYGAVVAGIDKLGLGYMHVIEGATMGPRDNEPFDYARLRAGFRGLYMANNSYDRGLAKLAVGEHRADLVAFGRPFITNPDLVQRLRDGVPLAPSDDKSHWYGGGAEGYTDYPAAT